MTEDLREQVSELLASGELIDVRFLSFSAALREGEPLDEDSDEIDKDMQVMVGGSPGIIEIRVDFNVTTAEADYAVVAATQFHYDEDEFDVSEEVGKTFAETVGVMAIFPYIREGLQSMSLRLRQEAITLPLLRNGQVVLTNPRPETDTDPDEE
ncbi:hypothetical protein [Salinibacterium sp. SWN1162]|uniref:hypothetical protein n=1 Tax=Salinibacterium sp. SWN1162 TaxID=2792053 RepID=UPI0018CD1477|nr:hypothetical protein [Salinibacterium sp. SWN1162]MBH0009987.1 hypothetical protein [Salinibacterium sp. SWN1162]